MEELAGSTKEGLLAVVGLEVMRKTMEEEVNQVVRFRGTGHLAQHPRPS